MNQTTIEAVNKVLTVLPVLAPDITAAILTILQSPQMSKEELLAQAEDLDNQTLAIIERELANF